MYLYSDTSAGLLFAENEKTISDISVSDKCGRKIECPILNSESRGGIFKVTLDARALSPWSPSNPMLYTFGYNGESVTFGYSTLTTMQNKAVLMNGVPIYLRGYIRGIVAHDHPNMTGKTLYDAAIKNISQAKKYGFNLVRFHSTIPTEEFVSAADELGMLVHMEIGFAYEYDEQGQKKNLSMSNDAWRDTIIKYRNHPSVAVFCIGNELHNSGHYPEVKKLYDDGKRLAPSKLIMDNSGWGEYDRETADIYSQHIAYFFPYKHHKDMFLSDNPWRLNGSAYDAPLEETACLSSASAEIRREATPLRPTLSHEAMHYIDVPDYDALNKKFDYFIANVGEEYAKKYGIKKPRYLTELPKLIERKGLSDRMPDYISGSRKWKLDAMKIFLERIRFSKLCGFEMLQLSDCLKYENKNGIIDFFDDDKGIDVDFMRSINADVVLLADIADETFYEDERQHVDIFVSDFAENYEIRGTLTVTLDDETIYTGENFILAGGLQKLCGMDLSVKHRNSAFMHTLAVSFAADDSVYENSWKLWSYPRVSAKKKPELTVSDTAIAEFFKSGKEDASVYLTDTLDDTVYKKLEDGKRVVLLYEHKAPRNAFNLPGALERFKPCIWDRGSNLGGMIYSEKIRELLAADRYFDLEMQPLLEAGSKVNLDHFPVPVEEHVSGIDKPVRDRMKGLLHGVKDFIDDDTLRRFSHLFSINVGAGKLTICTFNFKVPESPTVATILSLLVDSPEVFATDKEISLTELSAWIKQQNDDGIRGEDVMNHFWEIDSKPVEDTLFWEEAGVNLAKTRD